MKIEKLIEKYFEGKTTREEELKLYKFFSGDNIPDNLKMYRPIFMYLQEESNKAIISPLKENKKRQRKLLLNLVYSITTTAAILFLCFFLGTKYNEDNATTQNYVVINGIYSYDRELIKSKAEEALHNVSFTKEELKEIITPDI